MNNSFKRKKINNGEIFHKKPKFNYVNKHFVHNINNVKIKDTIKISHEKNIIILEKLDNITKRIDNITKRIDTVGNRLNISENRLDIMENNLNKQKNVIINLHNRANEEDKKINMNNIKITKIEDNIREITKKILNDNIILEEYINTSEKNINNYNNIAMNDQNNDMSYIS